jgi:hypothetical protein
VNRGDRIQQWSEAMPFYGPIPFDSAEAAYLRVDIGPGFFAVTVKGQARNFTTGITLVRDLEFVGGLAIKVMGWVGPIGQGTKPYTVSGRFIGAPLPDIVVIGQNKTEVVRVRDIPFTNEDNFVKEATALGG